MRFDLIDLRLFLAVLEAGSITHGAEAVGLSLPAASQRLRDMEIMSDLTFLKRGRRGVTPTKAGEALAHHAVLIQRQMAQMRNELDEHAQGIRTVVPLMAPTAAITEHLPDRLATWMALNPNIDVELKERQSSEVVRALAAGLTEVGIVSDTVTTEGLQLRPFAVDQLVVVTPLDHPFVLRKEIFFADILHEHFVGLTECALQDNLEGRAHIAGGWLKIRVRTRTFEGICRMAARGVGIGIVPETTVRHCRQLMKLGAVRLADDWAARRLSVCTQPRQHMSASARSLADHLAQSCF